MDKLKKSFKHLIAPAIVLLLVAIMGIFSPVVSVVAALRVNAMAGSADSPTVYAIENLPARTVEVNTAMIAPTFTGGTVKVFHAGKEYTVNADSKYGEIGQYEWRFYDANDMLFDTYTVMVTDTTYSMTMPEKVVTVAPKDLTSLILGKKLKHLEYLSAITSTFLFNCFNPKYNPKLLPIASPSGETCVNIPILLASFIELIILSKSFLLFITINTLYNILNISRIL